MKDSPTEIDINCDLGEGFGIYRVGNDETIMSHITSANIACGFHAGDPTTMDQAVRLAKKFGVAVGAHPSYPDLQGFGRREMKLNSEELKNCVLYQISAIEGFATSAGTGFQHVKPHGALYNQAAIDAATSEAIVKAVKSLDNKLAILAPPESVLSRVASEAGLRVAHEFFADRAYNPDMSLVSRQDPRAVICDKSDVLRRTMRVMNGDRISAVDGQPIYLTDVNTICIHGDTPNAATLASTLKKGLAEAGIHVLPLGEFL